MTSSYESRSNSSTVLTPKATVSCVVFFDEINSIAPARGVRQATEGVVSQILTEMDGIIKLDGVVVLAATNRLDMTDPALLRSCRFDKIIQIPNPDGEKRKKILEVNLNGRHLGQDINNETIAKTITESLRVRYCGGGNTALSIVPNTPIAKYPMPKESVFHASQACLMKGHLKKR